MPGIPYFMKFDDLCGRANDANPTETKTTIALHLST